MTPSIVRPEPVSAAFFRGPTVRVARRLIGARLVHRSREGTTVGRIVETEAYLSRGDSASHSHPGPTSRNASMFLGPGHAYVYLIYGLHHCFNVVTGPRGVGEAVLIRALEPLEGIELMRERRGVGARDLCNGPGKLVQAMGFGLEMDGETLMGGPLFLARPEQGWQGWQGWREERIESGPRVGITKAADLPLRFRLHGR